MENSSAEILDSIVIGAGHSGLAISYFLKKNKINHLVFERGRIAESWQSQRWQSFTLNTPNWMNILPGDSYQGNHPYGFFLCDEFVNTLKNYATKFRLPVKEFSKVISVEKSQDKKYFEVAVEQDEVQKKYMCKQLVVASGSQNVAKIPSISKTISDTVFQIHASTYLNASQLPEGNVLVVGSGQSGCQIVDDLLEAKRKVFLSTSMVGRVPRRYRGKDIMEWNNQTKILDATTESVTDAKVLMAPQPQVSGVGEYGLTVSLQQLAKQGTIIIGKLYAAKKDDLFFEMNAAMHVKFADDVSKQIKDMIDAFISQNRIKAPAAEIDEADLPDINAKCVTEIPSLNLKEKNITSIIWTTGFTGDFSWIKLPVTNATGQPIHNNGVSSINGLYFIGFPWLRKRKSGIVFGIHDDAKFISDFILKNHIT